MKIEIKKSIKPVDYFKAIDFLEKRLVKIDKKKGKELIWILEHPSIYTAGTSYKENEVLDKSIKLLSPMLRRTPITQLSSWISMGLLSGLTPGRVTPL